MRIIKQSHEILTMLDGDGILMDLERAGRTCYQSISIITPETAREFVKKIIKNGHESVLEHHNITVRFITNRGVTHELVRHRLASYSQESTRYCDYGKTGQVTFILPVWLSFGTVHPEFTKWESAMKAAEWYYKDLRRDGWGPEKAREVLPNALKTEIVMTANLREWRWVFSQRTTKNAHPQMRELMLGLLEDLRKQIPVIFDTLSGEESK